MKGVFMKRFLVAGLCIGWGLSLGVSAFCAETAPASKGKFILLIAEQNIEGPQKCWWASEIDLSVTESVIAQKLLAQGYEVLEPSVLNKTITRNPAFKVVGVTQENSVKLGKLSAADYIILGKALATSGGNVPQSSMRSCFANISAKIIRVHDGKVLGYLDASGSSAHMDAITGGMEALRNAAGDLTAKIIDTLTQGGGK
jgi:hypothetical protein